MCLQAVLKSVKCYVTVKHVQNIKVITGTSYLAGISDCGIQKLDGTQ